MSADPVRDGIDRMAAAVLDRRSSKDSYERIARRWHVSVDGLRRQCDPAFRERDNSRRAFNRRRWKAEHTQRSAAVVESEYEFTTKFLEVPAMLGSRTIYRKVPISLPRVRWLERSL